MIITLQRFFVEAERSQRQNGESKKTTTATKYVHDFKYMDVPLFINEPKYKNQIQERCNEEDSKSKEKASPSTKIHLITFSLNESSIIK